MCERPSKIHNNTAYKQQLPNEWAQVHPTFHPWLLYLAPDDALPSQVQHEPGPVEVTCVDDEGQYTYSVATILDS